MNIENSKIAFIGIGRMGQALIQGIAQAYPKLKICASDEKKNKFVDLPKQVKIAANNIECINSADIVILAVKPQNMDVLLNQIGKHLKNKVVVSIAAGISISFIKKRALGASIIRTMPNTPALVKSGITAITPDKDVDGENIEKVKKLFLAVGDVIVVDEEKQDAVVAISGSGPAYFYKMIDDLAEAGKKLGLNEEIAYQLASATAYGAANTVMITKKTPNELIDQVKSPKGTTEKALEVLQKSNFKKIIADAVLAAYERSKEITTDLNS